MKRVPFSVKNGIQKDKGLDLGALSLKAFQSTLSVFSSLQGS